MAAKRSDWRATSSRGRPSISRTSSNPRIRENARLEKIMRSSPLITATPSIMLPRIAEERLRSSVNTLMLAFRRAAVSFSARARSSRPSPAGAAFTGRKSPKAMRAPNSFRPRIRREVLRRSNSEIVTAEANKIRNAVQTGRRMAENCWSTSGRGRARRRTGALDVPAEAGEAGTAG